MTDDERVAEVCRQLTAARNVFDGRGAAKSGAIPTAGVAISDAGMDNALGDVGDARLLARSLSPLADDREVEAIAQAAIAHIHGLGPLQRFLADPLVNEIMVNNGGDVWVERDGTTARAGRLGADVTPRLIERILNPLGRRLDRLSPVVDARLPDGSRVCAVIPPIAVDGPCLTLRRFAVRRRSLTEFASTDEIGLLHEVVDRRCNVLVSGATSSGKTSLLNALMSRVAATERIITLEDTAELRLDAAHVVRLETRPQNVDGTSAITLADLVRTALRLRPDRIVVGEVRGAEVVDMLQALNTGHDGSLTTCHANGPYDALRRLHSLIVQHTDGWSIDAIREHVCSSLDVIIHVERGYDGLRHISEILELGQPDRPDSHRLLSRRGVVLGPLRRGRT